MAKADLPLAVGPAIKVMGGRFSDVMAKTKPRNDLSMKGALKGLVLIRVQGRFTSTP
jgi:hypothetical protein